MFELLPSTQANSVLPVELSHCFTTDANVEMCDFQELTFDATANLGFDQVLPPKKFTIDLTANLGGDEVLPPKPPKSFKFDATANLGADEVAPRPK